MNSQRRTNARQPRRFHPGRPNVAATLALAILMATGQPGAAQQQTGVVTGQVTIADSGEPLPSATVLIRGTERGTLTGADGRFSIQGVPAGERVVEARGLGYRGAVETVSVVAGEPVQVDFELVARPLEVGGISVNVLRPDLQPQADLTEREVRRANPQDAGQVLRNLDGVDAARRGPLGLDPVVRGLRETEVGTYLDGTRLFPAGPARMDSPMTHLDPSAIQSIEVVKGPYALTWGAGNLSAIRVETAPLPPRYDEDPSGSISTGYDSNRDASEITGTYSGRAGSVSYWTHAAWRDGGDYEPGDSEEVIPGDFESAEVRGKIGYDVGDNTTISVAGGYQDQGPLDYPGRLLTADFFYSSNLAAEWLTEREEGLLRRFELSAYRNDVSHGMDNSGKPTRMVMPGRTPPFSLNIVVDSDLEVSGGRAAADLTTGPWSFRVGGDLYSAHRNAVRTIARRADDFQGGPPPGEVLFDNLLWPDATITDLGAYGRTSYTLESGIQLSGTVRMDQVWADADTASVDFLDYLERTGQSQDLEDTETNLSVATTVGFPLSSSWNLSLGFGSAVRTADVSERYSDHLQSTKAQTAAEFMGNPDLEPERSNQADLWLEGTFQRTSLQLNLFGRRMSDYITVALADEQTRLPLPIFPSEVYRYVNGGATFFGGEASVIYGLTDVLTADVGLSYLWGEETVFPSLDDPDMEVTEPAFGVSPFRGRVGLRYEETGGRYFLEGTATLVAEQDRVATTRGETATDGYQTVDLRAGWAPLQGVNLRFGVENVLDEGYVNHLNSRNPYSGMPIPEPGRVFFLDVSYGF